MNGVILAFLRVAGRLACALRGAALLVVLGVTACGNPAEQAVTANPPVADLSAIPPSPALALVLSSGGPRGFAHIGVLKVLEEAGVHPDLIVGTSSGALVGVLFAANPSARDIEAQALALGGTDVFDYDVFRRRVSGAALQAWVNGAVADRPLDRLVVPVVVVATRQHDEMPVAFTRGDAGAAVRASSAVPGSYAPVEISGTIYVDGDIAAPLPIAIARRLGARRVIAVDVAQNVSRAPPPPGAPEDWTLEAVARRIKIEREEAGADLVIVPLLPYRTGFSLEYRQMAIATGERAARSVLPQLRALAAP